MATDPTTDRSPPAAGPAGAIDLQPSDVDDALAGADRPVRPARWWSLPLRLAVSAVLVWFLVRKVAGTSFAELVSILSSWTAATVAWLALAAALTVLGVVLAAARWKQVLVALAMASPPFARLVGHYFAGQFVSNVLPTTIGGDVLRAARLAADTGDGPDSFASLVIERLTGWFVLPLLTVAGLLLSPAVRASGHPATVALTVAGVTFGGLLVILFAADHPRLGGRFATRRGWRRFLGAVHLGVGRLRRNPRAALGVVAVGALYQLVLVLAAVAAARSLDVDVAATTMFAVFPAVLVVQVLPIGISGVGVRETALVFFLAPLGVPDAEAVALGILLFALNLAVSLLGAPAFVAGGRRRSAAPG